MKSLQGYFKYVGKKTFIDKYPPSIINLEDLYGKIFVEFGGGIGNDMNYLVSVLGLDPKDLYFIDSDKNAFKKAQRRLKPLFQPYDNHLLLLDILNLRLKKNSVDFVYANNFLHCLETKDKVKNSVRKGYEILKDNGIFFGRTTKNYIDREKLKKIEEKSEKSFAEEFIILTTRAFEDSKLLSLSENELEKIAFNVGYKNVKIVPDRETWKPMKDIFFKLKK